MFLAKRPWATNQQTFPIPGPRNNTRARATTQLKRRKQALTRLLAALRDPEASAREEDALRQLAGEMRALEKSQHGHERELGQCMKQVDASRAQVAARRGSGALDGGGADRGGGADPEQREEQEEEYLRRLQDMLARLTEASTQAVGANAVVKGEWESWFEMLSSCARRLQAKADAGAQDAVALPEDSGGDGGAAVSTPAFRVLELVRSLSTRHDELRMRAKLSVAQEKEVNAKLVVCRERIAAQHTAIKHATQQTARLMAPVVRPRPQPTATLAVAAPPPADEGAPEGLPPIA